MVHDQLQARGVHDPATLAAMSLVPREAFVGPSQRPRAYRDSALSIGHGQTISQPYMVARMTELRFFGGLDTTETARILDVSKRTVERGWNTTRAWLRARLLPG